MTRLEEIMKEQKEKNAEYMKVEREAQQKRAKRILEQERQYEQNRLDTSGNYELPTAEETTAALLNEMNTSAQHPMSDVTFICSKLSEHIKFRPSQLMVLSAYSGQGKTTLVASLAACLKTQGRRVLIFSTEEDALRVYARIVQSLTGTNLIDMMDGVIPKDDYKWAESQKLIAELTKFITIIDINTKDDPRFVQTIDGFKYLWQHAKPETYDIVIVDYYQKIAENTQVPTAKDHEVHLALCRFLDAEKGRKGTMKNVPIIVMAQIKPNKKNEQLEAEERLWGRKELYRVCTYFIEIIPNKKKYEGTWIIWKNRHSKQDKHYILVGFDWPTGNYVDIDSNFENKQRAWMDADNRVYMRDSDLEIPND